jgi:hypothetical protein
MLALAAIGYATREFPEPTPGASGLAIILDRCSRRLDELARDARIGHRNEAIHSSLGLWYQRYVLR